MHTNSIDIVLVDKLGQVFETESIDDFLLVILCLLFHYSEVDLLQLFWRNIKNLIWQYRMPQNLPQ